MTPVIAEQFIGVELTEGIVDHFLDHLAETACNRTTES